MPRRIIVYISRPYAYMQNAGKILKLILYRLNAICVCVVHSVQCSIVCVGTKISVCFRFVLFDFKMLGEFC